jgi:hypothetical protein
MEIDVDTGEEKIVVRKRKVRKPRTARAGMDLSTT